MTGVHIKRDYSAHKKSTYRPYDEFVKVEVFSFDPSFTKVYMAEDNTLPNGTNATQTSWKSWTCYKSKDKQNDMVFNIDYTVTESGEYRFDVVYEFSSVMHNDKKYDTSNFLLGKFTIVNEDITVLSTDLNYGGVDNTIKRVPIFQHLNEGKHKFTVRIPHNCYCMGFILRKVKTYVGDNYYGDALGSEEGNMVLTSATHSNSGMTKVKEVSCEIAYDDKFECDDSPSGFYMRYMDEINLYIKNNNREIIRVFGGYITSILPNSDRTKISINAVDRLGDGQNKYILTQMIMLGGTKDSSEFEYKEGMARNFNTYPQALQYLSYVHETTLKSNISKNYTVDGEKYNEGLQLTYGGKKKIVKIKNSMEGTTEVFNNYIVLRNDSSALTKQTWMVYDAKDYAKVPPEITETPFLHITYGLGEPKTEIKTTVTETVDNAGVRAGSQSFTKCGVSQDGKYVMGIGLPSAGKDPKSGWTKGIFQRKCPHCGSTNVIWDWNWGSYSSCRGAHEGGSAEGHFFCKSCDADYSVQGYEHISGSKYRMKPVGSISSSSRAEAQKLKSGNMVAVIGGGTTITPKQIFEAITKLGKRYTYRLGTSSSYSAMKKSGSGDCWAFSDLIFEELKRYGISCRIMQYATNYANNHRSVQYVNEKGNWANFPYREYGWNTMLNDTSGVWNGAVIKLYKGQNMGNISSTSANSTSTQTKTITTTKGFDKDKPFQAYLKLTISRIQDYSAKKYELYVKFTQQVTTQQSLNTGIDLYWINDTVKQVTLKHNIVEYMNILYGRDGVPLEDAQYFLHSIEFVAPVKSKDDPTWYKFDETTQDFSSCKMQLYQIYFDNMDSPNPSDLNSCGKTLNDMRKQIVEDGGYYVDMTYGLHRKDDRINYRVNNNPNIQFTATEGDNNNILSWGNISYNPSSSMHNMSMVVFKQADNKYYYIDTKDSNSILEYGEQCTLATSSQTITTKEAYYNAVMSDKYNPSQDYSYTVTVPNYPNLRLGDKVKIVANAKKLNSVKEVSSLKITFNYDKMPRIRTEIGLGELAPDIQLKENIRSLRRNAKQESTAFSKTAIPVTDEMYYEWDR